MENCDFTKLSLPSYEEISCSPMLTEDFVGIRLRAPAGIVRRDWARIPVCGGYSVPFSFKHVLVDSVVMVVVDKNSGAPYSFNLRLNVETADRDEPDSGSRTDREGLIVPESIAVYFNVDLLLYYPELPVKETAYFMYAVLGPYKSNTVEIELVAK